MPDPYWIKIGENLKKEQEKGARVCRRCGKTYYVENKGGKVFSPLNECPECRQTVEQRACSQCGSLFPFDPEIPRKRCSDCVGNRSEESPRTEGQRISEGDQLARDEDP